MSKYSKEVKAKAIYLSEKGWGRYRIAKELKVPEGAVKSWLQKFNLSHNLTHKIGKQLFSADFKRKVIETRWKDKLSFKETAELFNLDNPSLIAAWQKRYLDEGILGLYPKHKGRPSMKPKELIPPKKDQSIKSDKERIKELEAEIARLKYEMSFYDDFMKEMREIAKPNRAVKKAQTIAIERLRKIYPLQFMLEYFGISRSTYYARLASIKKGDKYAEEREAIRTLVAMNKGRYGYHRITIALHKLGIHINHKVVMRIMKEENLTCKVQLKKYRSYRGTEGKVAPNIIKRNFTATKPDQKWTTDITEFHVFGRKVYLSPILDLYNGEIVSYEISERPVLTQVLSMLDKAFRNRPNSKGCILHSDQGWQYQHSTYQETLKNHTIIQSMSRKGNCLDNSVMENFFGLLKSELLYLEKFASYEDFISKLKDYIDYYNTKRIKLKLKGMSPVEYRTHSQKVA